MHLIFIYRWPECAGRRRAILASAPGAVRRGAARRGQRLPTPAVGVYFLLLLFQGSAIPSGSLNRDRNRGNSCETRRRVGIGVRAEVTPAPRRSRGRAPVRSDAFLSRFPLSGSTMSPLRHLSSIRFSLATPRWPLRRRLEVFPYSSNGYIKCGNDGKFDHREIRNPPFARYYFIILFHYQRNRRYNL